MKFQKYKPSATQIKGQIIAHCNPVNDGEYLKACDVYEKLDPIIAAMKVYCDKVDNGDILSVHTYNMFQKLLEVPKNKVKKQCSQCWDNKLLNQYYDLGSGRLRAECKSCYNNKHKTTRP